MIHLGVKVAYIKTKVIIDFLGNLTYFLIFQATVMKLIHFLRYIDQFLNILILLFLNQWCYLLILTLTCWPFFWFFNLYPSNLNNTYSFACRIELCPLLTLTLTYWPTLLLFTCLTALNNIIQKVTLGSGERCRANDPLGLKFKTKVITGIWTSCLLVNLFVYLRFSEW